MAIIFLDFAGRNSRGALPAQADLALFVPLCPRLSVGVPSLCDHAIMTRPSALQSKAGGRGKKKEKELKSSALLPSVSTGIISYSD